MHLQVMQRIEQERLEQAACEGQTGRVKGKGRQAVFIFLSPVSCVTEHMTT